MSGKCLPSDIIVNCCLFFKIVSSTVHTISSSFTKQLPIPEAYNVAAKFLTTGVAGLLLNQVSSVHGQLA